MRLEAEQMTARIDESYNVLRSELQRSRYDSQLQTMQREATRSARASWSGTARPAAAFSHATPHGTLADHAHGVPLQRAGGGSVLVGAIEER